MKTKFIFLGMVLWAGQSLAQVVGVAHRNEPSGGGTGVYRTKFGGAASERRLELSLVNSKLTVTGYNGDELIVEVDGFEPPPERAKGLRPLSDAGVDNTGVGLAATAEGATIRLAKTTKQGHNYRIKVPKNTALKITETAFWGSEQFEILDMEGEIEVKSTTSSVVIRNATGPVVGQSTSGDFEVVFARLAPGKPSAISLVSGEVDITLPTDAKATLKTKSISGEIYTDFEVDMPDKDKGLARVGGGYHSNFAINGGGTEMRLESISGNVYIRKKK
jgi:hypothetical protein